MLFMTQYVLTFFNLFNLQVKLLVPKNKSCKKFPLKNRLFLEGIKLLYLQKSHSNSNFHCDFCTHCLMLHVLCFVF